MRRLIIIMCVICCSTQLYAQSNGVKEFFKMIKQDTHPTGKHDVWDLYVGPRIGPAVSTLSSIGGTPKIGATGGGFFEVFFLENMSIEMGINYSWQGVNNVEYTLKTQNADGTTTTEKREYDYSLHYINTDYLCRWYPKASIPLSVYAGLHLARLFNAKAKYQHNTNIRDDLHRGDVAIPVGVSYEWGQWQADVRYHQSLRHIGRTARAKSLLDNANNQMLSLTVAYKIQLW